MTRDPFTDLGLPRDASADDVRAARRALAKRLHPDAGGDPAEMQRVNSAAAEALRRIEGQTVDPDEGPDEAEATRRPRPEWAGVGFDVPSFTVEALPVETFHALLLAGERLGTVTDEDPPYLLDVEMTGPPPTWCRLEVVPDAGASTVGLAAATRQGDAVSIETIRDVWVAALNDLDWTDVTEG